MISSSVRRFAIAVALATSVLGSAGVAAAQNVITGTDPCPKGYACAAGTTASTTSTPSSTGTKTASTPSTTGTTLQTILVLLGLS